MVTAELIRPLNCLADEVERKKRNGSYLLEYWKKYLLKCGFLS